MIGAEVTIHFGAAPLGGGTVAIYDSAGDGITLHLDELAELVKVGRNLLDVFAPEPEVAL